MPVYPGALRLADQAPTVVTTSGVKFSAVHWLWEPRKRAGALFSSPFLSYAVRRFVDLEIRPCRPDGTSQSRYRRRSESSYPLVEYPYTELRFLRPGSAGRRL